MQGGKENNKFRLKEKRKYSKAGKGSRDFIRPKNDQMTFSFKLCSKLKNCRTADKEEKSHFKVVPRKPKGQLTKNRQVIKEGVEKDQKTP